MEAVVETGFTDPGSVTRRYLRNRFGDLPDCVDLVPMVGEIRLIDDDCAVVSFSLQGTDDSGDDYVLVERVGPEPGAWVVLSSSIIGFDIPTISYTDGSINGTLSTSSGGTTLVKVFDANTNSLIMSTEVSQPSVDEGQAEVDFHGARNRRPGRGGPLLERRRPRTPARTESQLRRGVTLRRRP